MARIPYPETQELSDQVATRLAQLPPLNILRMLAHAQANFVPFLTFGASILTAQDMIQGMRAIDGPDIEAIVQFGANLPMARLADEAERWLNKPVISINVATYWHALRMNGITDKLYGFTQLMSRF